MRQRWVWSAAAKRTPDARPRQGAGHAAVLLALVVGCSEATESLPASGDAGPPPPEQGCPPSETDDGDSGCIPAGIPPAACAPGFVPDGDSGCEPVLPNTPCAPGQMALPGDESCHGIMSCGTGRWGELATDETTQHVDGSYAGGDSDGSADRPWLTISEGVGAAEPGALVAVAEGSYHENVTISGKHVRLWGRCPELVELVGAAADRATVIIAANDGAQLGGMAVTGPEVGVAVTRAEDVLLQQLWLHDLGWHGLEIHDGGGPASVTVDHTLLEACREVGFLTAGANLTLQGVVIRDTIPSASAGWGHGVAAQAGADLDRPSSTTLRGCVVERNEEANVSALGVDLAISGSVIRDVLPGPIEQASAGVMVQYHHVPDRRGSLSLQTSVLQNNGLIVASADAAVTATVIRDVPSSIGLGRGLAAGLHDIAIEPSRLHVLQSVVEHATTAGVMLAGAHAEIEQTIVRDTQLHPEGHSGEGLFLASEGGLRSHTVVRSSLIERNHSAGISATGGDLWVEHTLIRDQLPRDHDGFFGRGLQLQYHPESLERTIAVIDDCLIERHYEVGVFVVASEATITNTTIRDTWPGAGDGWFGDALTVSAYDGVEASAWLDGISAVDNHRAGISNFGAAVTVGNSQIQCNSFALHGSDYEGFSFWYDDQGGNLCGCAEAPEPCQVVSAGLQPPSARPDEPAR